MNKTIFITGATSGFGKAIAIKFAAAGYRCIITGRRKEKLLELAEQLQQQYTAAVHMLVFDVQNRNEVFDAVEQLPAEWQHIDILVNNAGLALGRDRFNDASIDDWDTMLHTNVNGLLYVSKAVLPLLLNSETPHIINMGSVAAKDIYESGNAYCASKAAVDAISKSMRIDLLPQGVKVTAIHPGAAETEFAIVRFKGDESKAAQTYKGFTPLYAEDVADVVFYCSSLPKHVCINDLVVTCTAQANSIYFNKKQ